VGKVLLAEAAAALALEVIGFGGLGSLGDICDSSAG
jgi:hypothetical protein